MPWEMAVHAVASVYGTNVQVSTRARPNLSFQLQHQEIQWLQNTLL